MSDLHEKIAEICKFSFCQPNDLADQILALLPSLKRWVKVEECPFCKNTIPFVHKDQSPECICKDTQEIRTPLQWEDVDWDRLLNVAYKVANYKWPKEEPYDYIDELKLALKTKSGHKIEREK